MRTIERCPHCDADFRGAAIPQEDIDAGYYGDDPEDKHFSRIIGIYDIRRDRTVEWMCPDCGEKIERTYE